MSTAKPNNPEESVDKQPDDSQKTGHSIVKAGNELFHDLDTVDADMKEQEKLNAAVKRRMLWLIPYNFAIIWGTLRYCTNINRIAKKYWPKKQKVKVSNLFMIATVQALGFISIYLGGTLAILGVNPIEKAREIKY